MNIVFILPGRGGRSGGVRSTVIGANHLLSRGHNVRILYRKTFPTMRIVPRLVWNTLVHRQSGPWINEFRGPVSSYTDITQVPFQDDEILVGVGMLCSKLLGEIQYLNNPMLQYIRGLTPWMPEVMDVALKLPVPKIAVSHNIASEIAASYGSEHLLGVVHNGVEPEQYFPSLSEDQRRGIGTIYGDHSAKAPETILEVLTRLRREYPERPQYVFGTSPRPRSLPKSIYRPFPSVDQARDLYSRCLVWLMASRSEGFSRPVLEAMACGCAVVATKCGGPQDIIEDGRNGFLVEIGNVTQMVDRVGLLLHDGDLRAKMVREAQATVQQFSWDKTVDRLETIFASLLERVP